MNQVSQPHPWADRAVGMVLAAAVGDALGWPHERRDRTRHRPAEQETAQFVSWERIAGSRFRPFTEVIRAGDYSDDTQMIIAVGRALHTAGDEWLTWLQRVEWPFLPLYERGAGASVKRACKAWARGQPPWAGNDREVHQYFATGANGAAMRVAPHVIRHHGDASFDALALDVVRDAATTHGHPRALLGALVHAHALWLSMRQPAPLAYGWLIEALLDNISQWDKPFFKSLPDEWQHGAAQALKQPIDQLWLTTAGEVEEFLALARKELNGGAVSAPTTFLKSQGLTSTRSRGSGTLCAGAAAYLAARSAASPEHALASAARLQGADTDTLASMTSSLLGAALGQEWLGANGRNIQDRPLLTKIAQNLLARPASPRQRPPTAEQAHFALTEFTARLADAPPGSPLSVPYRRAARVEAQHDTRAGQWAGRWARLLTEDGQRLHLLHSVHRAADPPSQQPSPPEAQLLGTYLTVTDVARVRQLLQDVFGVRSDRYGQRWAAYGNLVLAEDAALGQLPVSPPPAQLRMTSEHPQDIWRLAQQYNLEGSADEARMNLLIHVDPWLTVTLTRRPTAAGPPS